jgi:hypothetical protein
VLGLSGNLRFADRVAHLLERVEYRRADTPQDKAAIFRMRHDAYTQAGTIEARPSRIYSDPDDETPNAWLIGVFIDGELAGSLRLHISASPEALLPVTHVFSDVVMRHLNAGRTLIDATRFVTAFKFSKHYSETAFITLRTLFMAEEFFDADYITGACRVEHQAFYKRMLDFKPWAGPRQYFDFKPLIALLARDCGATRPGLYARFPFYRSEPTERRKLFETSSNRPRDVMEAIGRPGNIELLKI